MSIADIRWPTHKCGLYLSHNAHKDDFHTVAEAIERDDHGYRVLDWVNDEQRNKAIETNECWSLQWYPDTPIGSCTLSACDVDVLLDYAEKWGS